MQSTQQALESTSHHPSTDDKSAGQAQCHIPDMHKCFYLLKYCAKNRPTLFTKNGLMQISSLENTDFLETEEERREFLEELLSDNPKFTCKIWNRFTTKKNFTTEYLKAKLAKTQTPHETKESSLQAENRQLEEINKMNKNYLNFTKAIELRNIIEPLVSQQKFIDQVIEARNKLMEHCKDCQALYLMAIKLFISKLPIGPKTDAKNTQKTS